MAEPEDPEKLTPTRHEDDFDDDLVGFAHPRALDASRHPEPEPEPQPVSELQTEPEPQQTSRPEIEAESRPDPVGASEPDDVFASAEPRPDSSGRFEADPADVAPMAAAVSTPATDRASDDDFGRPGATRTFERGPARSEPGVTGEGDGRLAMAIYICLIGAAPSAGLTLVIALVLAWMARLMIKGWTRSHLLYQLRTSLIGVIAGVVGVLTLPLGVGVFVLSLTLIWVVVRGAAGLYRLMSRQPIRDPQTWSLP